MQAQLIFHSSIIELQKKESDLSQKRNTWYWWSDKCHIHPAYVTFLLHLPIVKQQVLFSHFSISFSIPCKYPIHSPVEGTIQFIPLIAFCEFFSYFIISTNFLLFFHRIKTQIKSTVLIWIGQIEREKKGKWRRREKGKRQRKQDVWRCVEWRRKMKRGESVMRMMRP